MASSGDRPELWHTSEISALSKGGNILEAAPLPQQGWGQQETIPGSWQVGVTLERTTWRWAGGPDSRSATPFSPPLGINETPIGMLHASLKTFCVENHYVYCNTLQVRNQTEIFPSVFSCGLPRRPLKQCKVRHTLCVMLLSGWKC